MNIRESLFKALDNLSEAAEVDLDEAKTDVYHQHMLKALGKTRLPKDHPYTSAIANNGDFVVHKSGSVVGRIPKGEHKLGEEVELDEVSKQTLGSYIKKAVSSSAALRAKADLLGKRALDTDNTANSEKYFNASDKAYKKHMNRISGTAKAVDRLTKEETDSSSKDATVKSTKSNVTKDTTATTPYDVKPLRVKMAQFRKLY